MIPLLHLLNVIVPPLSLDGSILTIRKFAKDAFRSADLVAMGTLTDQVASVLAATVEGGMNIFRLFRTESSAPVARERLQILLEYERRRPGGKDLAAVLRDEIIAVISRHVTVDPDRVQVKLDRRDRMSTLAVDIQFPNAAA